MTCPNAPHVLSQNYRGGGQSNLVRNPDDALAYALVRMPATYAAVAACLGAIADRRSDFAPHSLLDVGAGPGTATWAAAEAFSSIDMLNLLDTNAALRELALDLANGHDRLAALRYRAGDAGIALIEAQSADLVIASYVLGELPLAQHRRFAAALWDKTSGMLLVVEPGTPAGYARILELRTQLIAAGAHVIAPCPHDKPCPLSPPDWCHFSQRLARSRDHKQVKGAELPFEDEKFAYVALSRTPQQSDPTARVLAQPVVTKVDVLAKLCTADGSATIAKAPRRDKEAYAQAKRWRWGDALDSK